MAVVPTFSVVIPCYRHAEGLARCLDGLAAQVSEAAWEVIVVNSAADPGVAAATKGRARLVQSQSRLLPDRPAISAPPMPSVSY